jgi:hypothetical protein
MTRRIVTCTRDGWNVGTSSPIYEGDKCIPGVQLSVFKVHKNHLKEFKMGFGHDRWQYGEGNGRIFPDSDAAFAWALEHGYTQDYNQTGGWCTKCRRQHWFLGHRSHGDCQDYSGSKEAQAQWDAERENSEQPRRRA